MRFMKLSIHESHSELLKDFVCSVGIAQDGKGITINRATIPLNELYPCIDKVFAFRFVSFKHDRPMR